METVITNERPMTEEIARVIENEDIDTLRAEVNAIVNPETCPKVVNLTAYQAAFIYVHMNKHNRDLMLSRVGDYQRAMQRGEWLANHQGIAFYPDGTLADGQHRCAALALSGASAPMLIFTGFEKAAIQTIDQVKPRSAGDALKMEGVTDGALKSSIIKAAMSYLHLCEHGVASKYTTIQLVTAVNKNDTALTRCLNRGDRLLSTTTDAPMKRLDAALHLFIMTEYGGFTFDKAGEFLASVLTGIAPYEGAPQLALSRLLTRAKHGAKTADKLNGLARIATIQKAATIWVEEQKCSKLVWSKKEGFPLPHAPAA